MKIAQIDELARIIRKLKAGGKKIVHCHGCFDLMHPGHIRHFQSAKKMGDVLIVTVTPDEYVDKGPGRPVFSQDLRVESIAALGCVDYVAVNRWPTAEKALRLLKPHIYVKGQEFKNFADKTGKLQGELKAIDEIGAQIRFTEEVVFSSTVLINRHFKKDAAAHILSEEARDFLQKFSRKYSFDEISAQVGSLRRLKVLLIGDGIIDEYHYCDALGRSAKAPLVVNKYIEHEVFAGGAFAIANHIAGLCGHIHLVSLLGEDPAREDFIRDNIKANITAKFFYRRGAATIVKKRYINRYQNQKLFEVNYLNDSYINGGLEQKIIGYLDSVIHSYDLVLVSDFGHGFITNKMIRAIEGSAKMFAVNTQTNAANAGYNMITKYSRPSYVCLDEPELRWAMQERFADIEGVAQKALKATKAKSLIVTLGKRGSLGVNYKGEINRTPIFSFKVVDTVGAGDAFFAFTAPCIVKGLPLDLISFIGNAVGALAVQIVCNKKPVEKDELLEFIGGILR